MDRCGKALRNLVVCLLCVLTCQVARPQSPTVNDAYAEGEQAFQQKRFRAAAEAFSRAAATDALRAVPLHPDAGLREARARFEVGDYPLADEVLRRYLVRDPRSAEAMYLLAFTQQRENQPRQSLGTYNMAVRLLPPTAEDLRRASLNYVLLDDYADARRWLERATALDAKNAEAWYDLARVEMHDGVFEEAIASLRKSLSIRPGDARALGNLGKCLENQNRVDAALAAYAEAVAAAGAMPHPVEEPFLDYGALLRTRNRSAEALPLLRRATQLAPKDAHAFEELGGAEAETGDAADAAVSLERAVALSPKDSRLHFQLARVYRTLGQQEKARQEFAASAALYGSTSKE